MADHHEPGDPAAHQGHAGGRGGHGPDVRSPAGGQPPGPEGAHCQRGIQVFRLSRYQLNNRYI